jgi:hypothetical protein
MNQAKMKQEKVSQAKISDYEECGHCGFDHAYEPEEAYQWHTENDPEGKLYA